MSESKRLFEQLSYSNVFLNEENHVYIHKKTGEVFTSVTGALNLVKSPFDKEAIIPRMQKKNQTFVNWFKKKGGDLSQMPDLLALHTNYEKKRIPISTNTWEGKETPRYKAITHYETIQELYEELDGIRRANPSSEVKATYLNSSYNVMDFDEISALWDRANLFSRHYGHLIHNCLEHYVLTIQNTHSPSTQTKIEKQIRIEYEQLIKSVEETDFGFNKEYFSPYFVTMPCEEFREYIVEAYKKSVSLEKLGTICIPEKIIHSPTFNICGMADQLIVTDYPAIQIPDHKTNKKFTHNSEYGKYLSWPFEELEDCSASSYMLQINTYGYILETEYDLKFEGGWISYFDRANHQFNIIDIPVRMDLAEKLLQCHRNHLFLKKEQFGTGGWLDGIPVIYHNFIVNALAEDVKKRLKNETIDVFDITGNRKYYREFGRKIVNKLKKIKR